MTTEDLNRLLTLREGAARARMGESTLRQALAKGTGPKAYKPPGSSRWRILAGDIDAWIVSGRQTEPPAPIKSLVDERI
jgi:predicted DNA-binding transcriptional regulator AlpA